eukprot:1081274-Pyramimonas_sp.AAC.1
MGWKLSLWIMQHALEVIVRRAPSVRGDNALFDGRPALPLRPMMHTEHVDNCISLRQSQQSAGDAARAVSAEPARARLPVHPVEDAKGGATL